MAGPGVSTGADGSGIGQILGTGSGRGIGLIFLLMGAVKVTVALLGRSNPHIRNVEDELPDAILVPTDSLSHADA
jgi:DHA3 family macrolide efflux protein-like MFS transporter